MDRTIIGIVSGIGGGKDTAGNYLKREKGYAHVSLSDEVRKEAAKRGLDPTDRGVLQDLGDEMRKKSGSDVLARRAAKLIKNDTENKKVVITGIRHPEEMIYLKKEFGAWIIGILATADTRAELFLKRKREGDPQTYREFIEADKREMSGWYGNGRKPYAMRVDTCLGMVDDQIINEKIGANDEESKHNLEKAVDAALERMEAHIVNRERSV